MKPNPSARVRKTPPEFEWVTIQMEVTRWVIVAALSLIGTGVWAGAINLITVVNKVQQIDKTVAQQGAIDSRQDSEIAGLKNVLSRHEAYLEQILQAVRRIDH